MREVFWVLLQTIRSGVSSYQITQQSRKILLKIPFCDRNDSNCCKSYAAMGECPPDEFLQECLSDPVLKIQLKRWAVEKGNV
jgi:hypothetical protein